MENFKLVKKSNTKELPNTTGVYSFKKDDDFLYIGKAKQIRKRVKTHFKQPNHRDELFVKNVKTISYIETDSEIEALILEANLIKKYQPKYNILWKDDKYFSYATITKERLPRVYVAHKKNKERMNYPSLKRRGILFEASSFDGHPRSKERGIPTVKIKARHIGPFIDRRALRKTLRLLRKIFPYYTSKKHAKKPCTWCQIKLCPGPNANQAEYKKSINRLVSILRGNSKKVLRQLKKEMEYKSKVQNFEAAGKLRDKFLALEKVLLHGKIFERIKAEAKIWAITEKELRKIIKGKKKISRIEAYDISNIQGQNSTGSMVAFINGQPDKKLYRLFKIKKSGKPNDFAMIAEIIQRRFTHQEWDMPSLILIDGGRAQLNAAKKAMLKKFKKIPVMAIAKKNNKLYTEQQKQPFLLKNLAREVSNLILRLRDESHRFAITYHKKLREKGLLK
jgi:excinuclease ABC subunit C